MKVQPNMQYLLDIFMLLFYNFSGIIFFGSIAEGLVT